MASEQRSLNDLPDEILLKILSHFGPEDLCLNIAKVCEKWNILAKDVVLWKTLSYDCDLLLISAVLLRLDVLNCLGLGLILLQILPCIVRKVQNLKRAFQKLDLSPS